MIILPTEFTRKGWHHKQIKRDGRLAIYERWKDISPKVHYEVIIIVEGKDRMMEGRLLPASELYPSDAQFGEKGWSYPTEEAAIVKYRELTQRVKKVKSNPTTA